MAALTVVTCAVSRFLRHVPVVYVDYPGPASLTQIYGTFNRAMLRLIPSLRTYAEPLTAAMVEFYNMSQVKKITKYKAHRKLVYKQKIKRSCFSPFVHTILCLHVFNPSLCPLRNGSPRTPNLTTSTLPER